MEYIDYERLRKDLIDYFGSAMFTFPMAIIDLTKVENCTNDELIEIAEKNNFDIENYIIKTR